VMTQSYSNDSVSSEQIWELPCGLPRMGFKWLEPFSSRKCFDNMLSYQRECLSIIVNSDSARVPPWNDSRMMPAHCMCASGLSAAGIRIDPILYMGDSSTVVGGPSRSGLLAAGIMIDPTFRLERPSLHLHSQHAYLHVCLFRRASVILFGWAR
jgi:hypothetical protein